MNDVQTQDLPQPPRVPKPETDLDSLLSPVPPPGTRIEMADGRKHKKLHYYNVKILMFAVGRSRQILHQLELLQDQTEGQTDNELR